VGVSENISHTARSIKDQNNVLSNEEDILDRWRKYFEDLLELVAVIVRIEKKIPSL